jgi:hypothetical protein
MCSSVYRVADQDLHFTLANWIGTRITVKSWIQIRIKCEIQELRAHKWGPRESVDQ